MFSKIKSFFSAISNTRAAGLYMLLFAIAIGWATFVENDYGTSSAQDIIFRSKWFELLMVLFGITILVNIQRFQLIKQKKWASLSFHAAIIIIIIGAAVTRYFGTEGMMHIREGQTSNQFLSTDSYITVKVLKNGKTYKIDEPTYFSALGKNKFEQSYQLGNDITNVKLNAFIPNPKEVVTEDANGLAMLKVVIGGAGGREEYYVKQGDKVNINGTNFNFTDIPSTEAFNISLNNGNPEFMYQNTVNQMVMATQKRDSLAGGQNHPLMLRSLYTVDGNNFVFGEFIPKGKLSITAGEQKVKNESIVGLDMTVSNNGQVKQVMISGRKGDEGQPKILDFGDTKVALSYGAKYVQLPFSIKCRDFIMERYPGTENPSSYASEVTLIDPAENLNENNRIFMNNILEHKGYRFFQSSFDPDELGTYLSVNHDFWGTWISYIGYIVLTIGMVLTFFSKGSRFTNLTERLKEFE
jgi:ResB-like family